MEKKSRVFIAGEETFIGTALFKQCIKEGYTHVAGSAGKSVDLTNQAAVERFFSQFNPEYIFLVAGKAGGILANQKYPADLMIDNLLIACNVIRSSFQCGAKKLFYLASSCSYPRDCPQPMKEEYLLTGALEPTNEAYAVAKIAGIKLCQAYRQQYGANFIVGIPANVFGPLDDFSEDNSHVIAALLRRMHEARSAGADDFEVWGTGNPRREFIYVDDLANASIFLMNHYDGSEPINVGTGEDVSISELARIIKEVTNYNGKISFDASKPDGMPIKVLDTSKLHDLGWSAPASLRRGIEVTYEWLKIQL